MEILVPLTWQIPPDSSNYNEQVDLLQQYREQLSDPYLMKKLMTLTSSLLEETVEDTRKTREQKGNIVQLVLSLIRNLAGVPSTSVWTPDSLIRALHKSQFFSLFNTMISQYEDNLFLEWNVLLSEMYFNLLYRREPSDFFESSRNQFVKDVNVKKHQSTRHARFGGVFAVRLSTGEDYIVNHGKSEDTDAHKKSRYFRKPKLNETDCVQLGTVKTNRILRKVCTEFLSSCFNSIIGLL